MGCGFKVVGKKVLSEKSLFSAGSQQTLWLKDGQWVRWLEFKY